MSQTEKIDLITAPRWRAEDLGLPLPGAEHAVSVSLPCWEHVVGYEEGEPAVLERLQTGYPRFMLHRAIQDLFAACEARFAGPGERCFAFPSCRTAEGCVAFLAEEAGSSARVDAFGAHEIHAVTFAAEHWDAAKKYWQHYGEIVSSRRAASALRGEALSDGGEAAKTQIRRRIAGLSGGKVEDVYLHASGMGAIGEALTALRGMAPGKKTLQFGFPYVDVYKVQKVRGPGTHFFAGVRVSRQSSVAQRGLAAFERDSSQAWRSLTGG